MGKAEVKVFYRHAERAAEFLRERLEKKASIKVISHQDADGISSAAILAKCLQYYDIPFTLHFSRPKKSKEIAELAEEDYDLFIFLDQGSGQIEAIHKTLLAKHKDVLVIDHHPGEFPEHPYLSVLNPHTNGLNGAKDVSASGATYLVVESLDLKFRPLLSLALIGAIGDRQEFFSGFTGVNDAIVKRAVDFGLVELGEGLRLIGRSFRPVVESLRTSTRPYLVGLSGKPTACKALLDNLDIRPSVPLSHLDREEEVALFDAILSRVGSVAEREEFMHVLWGTLYVDTTGKLGWPLTFREYAVILDACGNLKKPEIGLAMLMGDKNAFEEASALLSARQEEMLKAVEWFVRNLSQMKEKNNFKYMDCSSGVKPAFVGEAISLLIESGLLEMQKPVVALSKTSSGDVKISARGTPGLAMEGANLGRALKIAASKVGGGGGGHDVAAAARVPENKKEEFLTELDKALEGES